LGEFEARIPVRHIDARLVTKQVHVDRVALRDNKGILYDEMVPMEMLVERESVPFTLAFKIQASQYFFTIATATPLNQNTFKNT
jgi:hypothetical protein